MLMGLKNKVIIIFVGVAVALLTFLGVRMATLDTSVSVITTFALPDLPDASILGSLAYGQQAVAVDGKITYESADQTARPIASTTKMILALAIMQKKPFAKGATGEVIQISEQYFQFYSSYVAANGSTTAVEIGEEISEYDALASVLLASSNNLADTLAIWAFGSIENYQTYATAMLESWGIEDVTIGPDASGYNSATKASAASLAKIGFHLLENPVLAEIVNKKNYTVPVAGLLTNTNSLLGESGISGIKTGYSGDASGYCLVTGYTENSHIITTVQLGAETRADSFAVSKALVDLAQQALAPTTIVRQGDTLGRLESWWNNDSEIVANADLETIAWADNSNSINLSQDALVLNLNGETYNLPVSVQNFQESPTLWQRFLRALNIL